MHKNTFLCLQVFDKAVALCLIKKAYYAIPYGIMRQVLLPGRPNPDVFRIDLYLSLRDQAVST